LKGRYEEGEGSKDMRLVRALLDRILGQSYDLRDLRNRKPDKDRIESGLEKG